MKNAHKVPSDLPAAACGRCFWHKLTDDEGNGKCLVWNEYRYYKCMVCSEYEMDPDINIDL